MRYKRAVEKLRVLAEACEPSAQDALMTLARLLLMSAGQACWASPLMACGSVTLPYSLWPHRVEGPRRGFSAGGCLAHQAEDVRIRLAELRRPGLRSTIIAFSSS